MCKPFFIRGTTNNFEFSYPSNITSVHSENSDVPHSEDQNYGEYSNYQYDSLAV